MNGPRSHRPEAQRCVLGPALLALSAWACGSSPPGGGSPENPRPNIILILCDDLGYGDVGCFGATKHKTPNIDRMAAEGRVFTSFYMASSVCSPSRAALMTGCYPKRVGLHENERGMWTLFPGSAIGIHAGEVTVAETLKAAGYATGIVGKWHLGDQPPFLPTRHGFDTFFGTPHSNDTGSFRDPKGAPFPILRDETVVELEPDQALLTKRYTEEAVRFIETERDEPFFLYLPHTAPHEPLHASEQFLGKSDNGLYGDTVEELDWSVGEILKSLAATGLEESTLVVFTSDNGGLLRMGSSNAPLRGEKASTWEGGQRVPCVIRFPGHIPAGTATDTWFSAMDLLPTFARLAGAEPLEHAVDGKDVSSILFEDRPRARVPNEPFFFYRQEHLQAVRSGKWKLRFATDLPEGESGPAEPKLFDLELDRAEADNVAHAHPDVVERLLGLAEACRADLGDGKRPGSNTREPGRVQNPKLQARD